MDYKVNLTSSRENLEMNSDTRPRVEGAMTKSVEQSEKETKKSKLAFAIDERPPLHIAIFYGLQIIVSNLPGTVTAVFLIHTTVCGGNDYEFLAKLMSTAIFMSGLATLIQVMFGTRLPINQGSSFLFFPPIIAMMSTPKWQCTASSLSLSNSSAMYLTQTNMSYLSVESDSEWVPRVAEISGGIISASIVQFLLGMTGAVGFLMRFVGPITLAPTVMLIGLSLFSVAVEASKHQWGVAILTIAFIVVLTTVLAETQVPVISWNRKDGFYIARYPLLRMFSNLIAVCAAWLLCYILTVTGALPSSSETVGYFARTDAKIEAIHRMDWFYIPYPGQFGLPTFGPGVFVGMLAATLGSVLESMADYRATATICEIQDLPKHAMNRGIAMEGLSSILSGLFGACHGTTSYSNVIGFIAYSGVASRWSWVFMSFVLMLFAIFGKLAGALAAIPEPIIGGMIILGLGFVVIVGMSQLSAVDLDTTRNQITIGLALMFGMALPAYVKDYPDAVNTGSKEVDGVFQIFLSTGPFVAAVVGFTLDNLLPGTLKERGMADLDDQEHDEEYFDEERLSNIFDLPFPTEKLKQFRIFSYFPFLPCYTDRSFPCPCKKKVNDKPITVLEKEVIPDDSRVSIHTSL